METTVKYLFENHQQLNQQEVTIYGWVRNNRSQKNFGFINFHDGTTFPTLQVVYEETLHNFKETQKIRVGSSVEVHGKLDLTPDMKQPFEIKATQITLLGDSPEDYPIQPKRHTREFLREVAHLRMRTNLFQAVFRVRSEAAMAVHQFFNKRGFVYTHTPLITGNDGEGAGSMFQVTTLDLKQTGKEKEIDYSKDFFWKTNLSCSNWPIRS